MSSATPTNQFNRSRRSGITSAAPTSMRTNSSQCCGPRQVIIQVGKNLARLYLPNALWSLIDLIDRDPSGFRVLLDGRKVGGALLLRHLLPIIIHYPWMTLPTIMALALIAFSVLRPKKQAQPLSSILRHATYVAESTSREIVEAKTTELTKRIDVLEESVHNLSQLKEGDLE